MIKDAPSTVGYVRRSSSLVEISVHVEPNRVWLPVYCKHVKRIGEVLPVRQCIDAAQRARSGISWPVKTAMIRRGLTTDVLHNVDLSTIGPSGGINITAEHPERRPYSLTEWESYSGLEPAKFLRELSLRSQARRRIVSSEILGSGVALTTGCDDQVPLAIYKNILGPAGIILEFIVPPAAATGVEAPLAGIRRGFSGLIELVGPNENVLLGLRQISRGEQQGTQHQTRQRNFFVHPNFLRAPVLRRIFRSARRRSLQIRQARQSVYSLDRRMRGQANSE